VQGIGAAYYVANLHKWVCAPKGAAMLVVREDRQRDLHPLTISHGYHDPAPTTSRFFAEFDWTGTDDPTAWLSVPEVIRFVGSLFPGGWNDARAHNHALALAGRRALAALLGTEPIAPDAMIGSLAAVRLPDLATSGRTDPLHDALFHRHRIEVPVFAWPASPKRLLRFSAAIYNTMADIDALAAALREELGMRCPEPA
jgi:isopenicillin-N epimerase